MILTQQQLHDALVERHGAEICPMLCPKHSPVAIATAAANHAVQV